MADVNIRGLVADSLVEMEKEGTFLSVLEKAVLDKYDHIDARDKAFYKRVLSGTVERKIRIDYILGLFSSIKINKMKPFIRAVLRSSIYQIMWMDSVPDSAVCNEAVKLINKRGFGGLRGFVNGLLRNICRSKDNILYPDAGKDRSEYLSVYYSCPKWIVDKFINEQGSEQAEKILGNTMTERPVSIRMRCGRDRSAELIALWRKKGISVKESENMEGTYMLKGSGGISSLEGYEDGAFVVQDLGSVMVAALAGIKNGDTVMDVCAAPGGKSIHAADLGAETVYSYDISEEKCDRIRENVSRLKIDNIKVQVHDAVDFLPEMEEKADVVIVDAPCSGLGVIGHKSDIKYRLKESDIEELAKLQRSIIDTAVRYVRPGGRLVYSTCTISRAENGENRDYILKNYPFKAVCIGKDSPDIQLLPGIDESDGFYISVFEKEKTSLQQM